MYFVPEELLNTFCFWWIIFGSHNRNRWSVGPLSISAFVVFTGELVTDEKRDFESVAVIDQWLPRCAAAF